MRVESSVVDPDPKKERKIKKCRYRFQVLEVLFEGGRPLLWLRSPSLRPRLEINIANNEIFEFSTLKLYKINCLDPNPEPDSDPH